MSRPLTNSQVRDAEALLHPYTDAVALHETGASGKVGARAAQELVSRDVICPAPSATPRPSARR